jgi:hypothetical protein
MSEAPEITPLEVLEVLADGQRKLLEFVKQRLSLYGRQDASCALNQAGRGFRRDAAHDRQ